MENARMNFDTEKTLETVSRIANGLSQALVSLNKCLLNNGALKPGQFAASLKGSFNHPDADWERLDYVILRQLAKELEESEIRDRN
jgi:hypothetical protein